MMHYLIKKLRMCKIQTQVIILQCVVILLFIIFWGLILLFFLYFYQQIFNEGIFRKFVGQLYYTTVNQVFNGVNNITNYQLFTNKQKYICTLQLFQIMMQYKIQINFKLERCLQTKYNDSFYKLQFCYGIYGNQSKDISIINKFVALQNIMLPIYFNQPLDNLAIISLDSDQYVAQYVGQYTPQINQTIIKTINQLIKNQQYIIYQSDGTNGYSIFIIPNANIAIFGKINIDKIALKILINNKFSYDVKSYLVQMDGKIILGNVIRNQVGTFYFNNTKLTGFNQSYQETIFNFIINNTNPSSNTCVDVIKKKLFCLMDANNNEQIIAGRQITNNSVVIFILDAKKVNQIRADLKEQFESFFYQSIKFYGFLIVASLFISFVIEYYLLWKLNYQIKTLQNIVHNQIRGNSEIKNLSIFKNSQSQIQQLSDAYQNLINLRTHKTHKIPKYLNSNKYNAYPQNGLITQQNMNFIIEEIKNSIKTLD